MSTADESAALRRNSLAMASGSVASRLLGVVRVSLLAAAIGTALSGDAFTVANMLPGMIYILLAGGVFNSVLVPQMVKAAKDPDGGQEFTDRIITVAMVGLLVLTVLATLAAPLLTRLVASGLRGSALELATTMAYICLPQVFFYGLFALLGQVLNARGRFLAFGWAPFVGNVISIATLALFISRFDQPATPSEWTSQMVWLIAGGTTLGIVVQPVVLWWALRRSGYRFRARWGLRGVGLGTTRQVATWALASLAVSQLGYVVASNVMAYASGQQTPERFIAGNNVYTNAVLIFTLPHALIALSIITAMYPQISRAAQSHDLPALRRDYTRGLTVPTALTWPACVGLFVFAEPIARGLFPTREVEIQAAAAALRAMALGVVPFSIEVLNQRFFYAHDNGRLAFAEQSVLTVSSMAVALSALSMPPERTVVVVAFGVVISNTLSSLFGMFFVRRRVGHLGMRRVIRSWVRMAIASAGAAAVGILLRDLLDDRLTGHVGSLVLVVLAGGGFGLVYLVLAKVMRVREIDQILSPVLRRLPGRR